MSSKKKASTKKSSTSKGELKSSLAAVRGRLTKTEAKLAMAKDKAERWKKEALAQRRSAERSGARVTKLEKKLNKRLNRAETAPARRRPTGPGDTAASGHPVAEPATADGVAVPDESWTVVQLRAEARARGLVGLSNKPKAQLLAALS